MRYLSITVFLILIDSCLCGQTGLGGVGSIDGSSNLIFWLDAKQITDLISGSKVTGVTDLSGYNNNVTNQQDKPQFVADVVNGNPVIRFDGVNSDLRGDLGNFDAPGTIIAFSKFDQTNQGTDDNDYVVSIGSETTAAKNTSIARRKDEDGAGTNEDLYYTWDGATVHRSSTTLTANTWYAVTHLLNTSNAINKYHQSFLDGTELSFGTDFPSALDSDGEFEIGDLRTSSDNTFKLDGDVAELAIFNKVLNTAELNIIHSYLAGKYDHSTAISGGTTYSDFYTGDDAIRGDYDLDIIGVGRHLSGETHDVSKGAGITLGTASFGDGDYAILGHKTTTNSVNSADISDTHLTDNLSARWERVWYIDVTDADNSITANLAFNYADAGLGGGPDGSATNYRVIYRSGQSGDWDLLDDVPIMTEFELIFKDVAIGSKGDGYYSLATIDNASSPVGISDSAIESNGPGGISDVSVASDLELWLDATKVTASNTETIPRWSDNSGKSNDATQSSVINMPVFDDTTNPLNGNGILDFDGNDDNMAGDLDANLSADATVIALGRFDQIDQGSGVSNNDYIISIGDDTDDNSHISISRRRDGDGNKNKYYSFDASTGGGTPSLGPLITGQQWILISGLHAQSVMGSQRHTVYFDGVKQTNPSPDYSADFSATTTAFEVGRWVGTGNQLDGQLAEVIVFSKVLNTAELNIIHSYLSAKWNHILTNNDKYTGDDLGNSGVCDGIVTCQPNYDLEVAGIGTESDGSNTSGTSAGMNVKVSSGQSSTFANGDYMLFGHKSTSNKDINTDKTTQMGDPTIDTRSQRDWFIDITETDGSPMAVDFTFDFTEMGLTTWPLGLASNYKLLFRTTNETDDEWTVLASGSSISDDQIVFTNISSITEDGFVTIGTINHSDSPLPVKLVHFDAELINEKVSLEWTTASEYGNAYFEIQKSIDGTDFETLTLIAGVGDSEDINDYHFIDEEPSIGQSYYRLKQVDVGGTFEFSELVRIEFNPESKKTTSIFPNPVSDRLHIEFTEEVISGTVYMRNRLGELVLSQRLANQSKTDLSLFNLSKGIYILEINWNGNKERRKILVEN